MKMKWVRFLALIPSAGLIFLDQTILPVALPTIQKEMQAGAVALQWCVDAYLLALAVLIIAGGKISDCFGHRKTYLLGMGSFAVSSALCAMSPDVLWLICSRALQGASAAILLPASIALMTGIFSASERGRSMGVNASIGSLFMTLGPLIGGYFTQEMSWRWVFWINLPLCAAGIGMVLALISPVKPIKQKIDARGFSLFVLAVFLFVFYVMQAPTWGWVTPSLIVCLLLSLLFAFLLVRHEKKSLHPFLDTTLYRHPAYLVANISVAATQFILMVSVTWAIYFQTALSYTPFEAGRLAAFSTVPVLFMAPIAGILADKISPKLPLALGFLCIIFSLFWLAAFNNISFTLLLIGLVLFGAGIPFILTPSYSAAINSVPRSKVGIASGQISTMRSLAGTFGIAIIGTLYIWLTESSLQNALAENGFDTVYLTGLSHRADAASIIDGFEPGRAQFLTQLIVEAQVKGFSELNLVLGGLVILGFAAIFVIYQRKPSHHLPESPAEGWD